LRAEHPRVRHLELRLADSTDEVAVVRARLEESDAAHEIEVHCRRQPFRGPEGCRDERPVERRRWVVAGAEARTDGRGSHGC
jgi:hypothetical protein